MAQDWSGHAFLSGESGSGAINTTLSSTARNIQGPVKLPYSSTLTITIRVLVCIYYLSVGAFLNTLALVSVLKYKKLQTYAIMNVLQVLVINLIALLLALVALINAVITNQWLFGVYMCGWFGLLLFIITTERTLLMCIFALDRFLSIFCPFFYPKYNIKITVILTVASWIFSVGSHVPSLPNSLDCYTFLEGEYLSV